MSELQQEKPIIVCLCGSTRFVEEFRYVDRRETLAGKIVLAPGCFQGDAVLEVLPGVKQATRRTSATQNCAGRRNFGGERGRLHRQVNTAGDCLCAAAGQAGTLVRVWCV